MPHAKRHHCDTEISDHTSTVEKRGELYCCNNCAEMVLGDAVQREGDRCANCGSTIVDQRTEVFRGNQTFCCFNCASAMSVETGR